MKSVMVLCYHRVYPGNHITPEVFDQQMHFIADHCICLTLDEVRAFASGVDPFRHQKKVGVALTFDDSWRDTFVYAFPILEKYRLQATVFVPTAFMLENVPPRPTLKDYWVGKASYSELGCGSGLAQPFLDYLLHGRSQEFTSWLELEQMTRAGSIDVQSHGHTHNYHFSGKHIVDWFDGNLHVDRNCWLLRLVPDGPYPGMPIFRMSSALATREFRPYPEFVLGLKQVLTATNVSQLPSKAQRRSAKRYIQEFVDSQKDLGIFESHTEWEARFGNEWTVSKSILQEKLGLTPKFLAWPFGETTEDSVKLCHYTGVSASFTMSPGPVRQGDHLQRIRRFGVPSNMALFSSICTGPTWLAYAACVRFTARFPKLSRWLHNGMSQRNKLFASSRTLKSNLEA